MFDLNMQPHTCIYIFTIKYIHHTTAHYTYYITYVYQKTGGGMEGREGRKEGGDREGGWKGVVS